MSDKKRIDVQSLFQQLEKLMEITGDNCGPLLIKELQLRMDKTIDTFNKDVEKLLHNSFDNHHNTIAGCKEIINNKKNIDKNISIEDKQLIPPRFIELYEKKIGKKL